MHLARFDHAGDIVVGLVDEQARRIAGLVAPPGAHDAAIALIEQSLAGHEWQRDGREYALDAVQLLPPIARPPKNVLCIGKNYRAHAAEFARSGFDASAGKDAEAVPEHPIMFSKAPCTMIGANEPIAPPWEHTDKVDYEGELGVIIGRGGRNIPRQSAGDHVWGYTVINDVTARDLQARHKQWLLGKSIDTFCPIGPWIVTADEVNAGDLLLRTWVNDELRQDATTRDLIFDIPTIIACLSASMTLETGDIIATGTPAGVGIGYDPPRFLAPGDRVRVSIEGLGTIDNPVA